MQCDGSAFIVVVEHTNVYDAAPGSFDPGERGREKIMQHRLSRYT